MAKTPAKIPPSHYSFVLDCIAKGLNRSEIKRMLSDDHGIDVSESGVQRLMVRLRKEFQQVAQITLAQGSQETASNDLEILNTVVSSLYEKYKKALYKDNPKVYLSIASELNKWNERRIKLSGIEKEDTHDTISAKEELLDQLEYTKEKVVNTEEKMFPAPEQLKLSETVIEETFPKMPEEIILQDLKLSDIELNIKLN